MSVKMTALACKLALFTAVVLAATGPVRAGDVASVKILGFSADGGIFAFEEYGIQDGSGFPYANRYYIDTKSDRFLPGTPVRVRLDDETATVEAARGEARMGGENLIPQSALEANPGFTAGWNAVTELSADPFRLEVNPRPVFPPADDPVEFRLEEIAVEQPPACENLGNIVGYRLLRVKAETGAAKLVHEDTRIPESRGCPLGYRIGGLQTYYPQAGAPVFALMIAIRHVGFEGPDYRWIAVTGRL